MESPGMAGSLGKAPACRRGRMKGSEAGDREVARDARMQRGTILHDDGFHSLHAPLSFM